MLIIKFRENFIDAVIFTVFLFGIDLFLGGRYQIGRNLIAGVSFFSIVCISQYLIRNKNA